MKNYHAIRQVEINSSFKTGDVLVLFGELFQRGYANGLVEEAQKRGMTVVRATVGRREKDNTLRSLNNEEIANIPQPFINIPLEAGFDLEPDSEGRLPVDQTKDIKLSEWENAKLDFASLESSRKKAQERFVKNTRAFLKELEAHVPAQANVLFAHLMAGGVPRTKIIMPLMNRSLKGTGERFLPSEKFWKSDLGKFCEMNFNEVTAETFKHLVNESKGLREKIQSQGQTVAYLAYGYHGTEMLYQNQYRWQTYTPYLQGWAKMRLENYSREFAAQGIKTCVYNCPEILTNSSSIFQGVEVCLYPLLGALRKEGAQSPKTQKMIETCLSFIKPEHSIDEIMDYIGGYIQKPEIKEHCQFEKWPQHNSKEQLETMINSSEHLFSMHKDSKVLMTFPLSEVVFSSCGKVMINDVSRPQAPVSWINHDIVAKMYSH